MSMARASQHIILIEMQSDSFFLFFTKGKNEKFCLFASQRCKIQYLINHAEIAGLETQLIAQGRENRFNFPYLSPIQI